MDLEQMLNDFLSKMAFAPIEVQIAVGILVGLVLALPEIDKRFFDSRLADIDFSKYSQVPVLGVLIDLVTEHDLIKVIAAALVGYAVLPEAQEGYSVILGVTGVILLALSTRVIDIIAFLADIFEERGRDLELELEARLNSIRVMVNVNGTPTLVDVIPDHLEPELARLLVSNMGEFIKALERKLNEQEQR